MNKDETSQEQELPPVPAEEKNPSPALLRIQSGEDVVYLPYQRHDDKGRPRFGYDEGGTMKGMINEHGGVLLTFSTQEPMSFGGRAFGKEGLQFGAAKASESRVMAFGKNADDEWVAKKKINQGASVNIAVTGEDAIAVKIRQETYATLKANEAKKAAKAEATPAPAPAAPKP